VAPLTFKRSANLGTVAVGNHSDKSVTLTNNETTTLNLSVSTVGQFAATGGTPCGNTIAADAKCTFQRDLHS